MKLPAMELDTFGGNVETWSGFQEQFRTSINEDASLSVIKKDVPPRVLGWGDENFSARNFVTANTCEETKKFLLARHADTNRIIQAHLDFLDGIPPSKSATPEESNNTFIECHNRIQAIKDLGKILTVTAGCCYLRYWALSPPTPKFYSGGSCITNEKFSQKQIF